MKPSALFLILFLWLGCSFTGLYAQQNKSALHSTSAGFQAKIPTRFLHYTISDGLPSNAIGALATDPEGFVWITTSTGLARWDGHRITPFNDLAVGAKIPEAAIKLLFCDSRGYLWIKFLLFPGLYQIDLTTFKINHFQQDFFASKEHFPPSAMEDRAGDVWFATLKGLSRYRWKIGDFEYFPLIFEGRDNIAVQATQTPDDKIWVATHIGLFLFRPDNHQYEKIPLYENDHHQHLVASDADGHLWIGRWYDPEHGVLEFDPLTRRIIRSFKKHKGNSEGFISTEIAQIFPDGNLIWFGCNEGGWVVWDKKQERAHRIEPSETNSNGLLDWNGSSVVKDKYGNYWVGSSSGLQFLPKTDKTAQLLKKVPFQAQSLVYSKTNAAYTLSNGNLVFGTDRGISIYNPSQHHWLNFLLPQYSSDHYNNIVLAFAEHDATSFWASSWDGLYLLDQQTGAILKEYRNGSKGPAADLNTGHHLFQDKEGTLWISYNASSLTRWRNGQFEFLDTLTNDGNRLNDQVNCFAEQDKQALLIGTSDGLLRFDYQHQTFETFPINYHTEKEAVKITSLCLGKNGHLYLIGNDHVYSVDLANNAQDAVPISFPFPVKNCLDLIEDDLGDIWVCTEGGLIRFNQQHGKPIFFDARNFLQGNTFYASWNFKKASKGTDGKLYFAGISGISVLRPDALSAKDAPPTAKITSLKIDNQIFVLDSAINRLSHLTLKSWQKNLTFEFSALGSASPDLNRYAYRMIGDQFWSNHKSLEWIDLGQQAAINFSNLSPGEYKLELRVANSDGVWCETPATLNITILPPWYRSWLAYLVYLLVAGSGAWAFYRYQLRTKLEQAENKRLKELDSFKSRFFTNITHEFRTPLTVILGMTDRLEKNEKEKATKTSALQLIRRNGQNLLRLINEILDLAKLESNTLKMDYVQGDVLPYIRYISESLHSLANVKNVMLRVESSQAKIEMDYDPDRLLQIVHNLLSNAIKFTPGGGKVFLRTEISPADKAVEKWLRIEVADTGVGIPPDDLPQIFDRFFQAQNQEHNKAGGTGVGLSLTRELVRAMGGEISAESTLGKGSTFILKLPMTNKAALADETLGMRNGMRNIESNGQPSPVLRTSSADSLQLLIIEDNADVVEYLSDCVGGQYQLDFAYNGRAGIEKATEMIPDIIISDVMMPEKDGFEVCDALKNDERTSHIPIVLLTARATTDDRIAGLRRGADAYLAKPFNPEELLVTLENLTKLRARLQARYTGGQTPAPSEDKGIQIEDAFLQKMRAVVEAKLSDSDFEMPHLQRKMAMSHSQIFRKTKALTGKSPSQFIRDIRLRKATELLASSDLTVSEIAYETGFSSLQYFSDTFFEVYGKRPSAMRN